MNDSRIGWGLLAVALAAIALLITSGCAGKCGCGPKGRKEQNAARGCILSKEEIGERQVSIKKALSGRVQTWHELPDGFAFHLPGDDQTVRKVFDAILFERKCCSFLRFAVAFDSSPGAMRLEMRTDHGDTETLRELLGPTGPLSAPQASLGS